MYYPGKYFVDSINLISREDKSIDINIWVILPPDLEYARHPFHSLHSYNSNHYMVTWFSYSCLLILNKCLIQSGNLSHDMIILMSNLLNPSDSKDHYIIFCISLFESSDNFSPWRKHPFTSKQKSQNSEKWSDIQNETWQIFQESAKKWVNQQ